MPTMAPSPGTDSATARTVVARSPHDRHRDSNSMAGDAGSMYSTASILRDRALVPCDMSAEPRGRSVPRMICNVSHADRIAETGVDQPLFHGHPVGPVE